MHTHIYIVSVKLINYYGDKIKEQIMKKNNLFIISLMALFTLGACANAGLNEKGEGVEPGLDPAEEEQAGEEKQDIQSAYDLLVQNHPEQASLAETFLTKIKGNQRLEKDLDEKIELIKLNDEETEECYGKLKSDTYNKIHRTEYSYENYYAGESNIYETQDDEIVHSNKAVSYECSNKTTYYFGQYKSQTYSSKSIGAYFLSPSEKQVIYYDKITEIKGYSPYRVGHEDFEYESYNSLIDDFESDSLMMALPSVIPSNFYKTADGHLYALEYSISWTDSVYLNALGYVEGRQYWNTIVDLNTVSEPKIMSGISEQIYECDVDGYGKPHPNYVPYSDVTSVTFEHGQRAAEFDKASVTALIPEYFVYANSGSVSRANYSINDQGVVTGIIDGTTYNMFSNLAHERYFEREAATSSAWLSLSGKGAIIGFSNLTVDYVHTTYTEGKYVEQSFTAVSIPSSNVTVTYEEGQFVPKEYESNTYMFFSDFEDHIVEIQGVWKVEMVESVLTPSVSFHICISTDNLIF